MDKPKCMKKITAGYHRRRCFNDAIRDGYCQVHHPDAMKARMAKRQAAYEERRKTTPWYKLEQAAKRIKQLEAEGVTLRSALTQAEIEVSARADMEYAAGNEWKEANGRGKAAAYRHALILARQMTDEEAP